MSQNTFEQLAGRDCVPCKGGVPALQGTELNTRLEELGHDWRVMDGHHLEKEYRFPNFREAMAFANQIGDLAEQHNHHPDLYVAWGKVKVTLWTHKVNGLTDSDFVMAAKIEHAAAR